MDDEALFAEARAALTGRRPRLPSRDLAPTVDRELAEALAGPAPCDGCDRRARCAQGLACSAFGLYLAGAGRRRWAIAPRADASAARFARLFRDADC